MSTQSQLIRWSISRMRRIVELWANLDWVDKSYILRRVRDKEPTIFYAIADEKARGAR